MKRRLALVLLAVAALTSGGTAAQALLGGVGGATTTSGDYFACAGTRHIDFGVCAEDPLPEHLPVPGIPG